MEYAYDSIQRIVVVGDAYVSPTTLSEAVRTLPLKDPVIKEFMWGDGSKDEFSEMQTILEKDGPDSVPYPTGLDEAMKDADMLMVHFCPVPASLIEKASQLKVVGVCRGGYENICEEALSVKKIPLIHVIRNAQAVAEFTLGMMLAETRNIARSHAAIMKGEWPVEFPNTEYTSTLANLKVGIMGLGNIGELLARKLLALDISVYGYDEYIDPEKIDAMGVIRTESKEELFSKCDVISLHLRLSDQNRGMINKDLLSLMKPTSYLINASRAGLIKAEDLICALKERKIAGAALDVFEEEPIAKDDPFLKLDNVTLTPHIAGDTVDAIARSPFALIKNIDAYLKDHDMRNVCNAKKII